LVVGTFVAGDISALTTSVTTLTGVTWPSHSGDDLALLAHGYGDSTNTGTMDAAFTSLADLTDTNLRAVIGKLIPSSMTGSESGDVTLTTTTGARQVGALGVWNGYTDVQQIVNQPETSGTAVTTHASPAITPQKTGSGFVIVYMDRVSTGNTTVTPPSGFTSRLEFGTSGTGGIFMHVADDLSGTHGLTPFTPGDWNVSVGSTSAMVYLVELAPVLEATGDRTATASLTGAAAVTREASGDRATTAGLVGAAGLTRTATGNLAATATLAGAADVTEAPPVPVASAEPRSPFLIEVWDGTSTPFVKAGRIGSYTSSEVILRHNQVGSWRFTLALTDGGVNLFTAAGRRVTIDYRGTRIMSGPAFGIRRARNGNTDDVEVYGYDDLIWLNRRLAFPNPLATFPADGVGFTQPTVRDAITDDAETMIKYWVTRNCVTRLAVPGLSVATNLARGAVRTYGPRWETVLEACARIADITGLGLRVTQVAGELSFDVYESATQPVRLSRSLGNLRDWEFTSEGPKKTRNVIGLDGEDAARRYMLSKLTSSETGWGITESFYDSSGDTDAERYEQGLDDLEENVPTYSFTVVPRDTESMRFGETYNLGDTVTTELLPSVTLTDKVRQVTITDSVENGVDVQPVVGDLGAAERASAVYLELRRLRARINKFEREA
jgi:hypothetical protein